MKTAIILEYNDIVMTVEVKGKEALRYADAKLSAVLATCDFIEKLQELGYGKGKLNILSDEKELKPK